jgi:hypothetical protein
MLQKTTIRRLLAVGMMVGALAAVAPATGLAAHDGGGGPRPVGQIR